VAIQAKTVRVLALRAFWRWRSRACFPIDRSRPYRSQALRRAQWEGPNVFRICAGSDRKEWNSSFPRSL